ncbi:MAG: hypothetical protein KDK45_11945, partial [Leptospiraceae bacterium]|nr:hypothetical protein [Leptospiraceae bacterium]
GLLGEEPKDTGTKPPAKETEKPNEKEDTVPSDYSIEYFAVRDLSKNYYWVSVLGKNPKKMIAELNGEGDHGKEGHDAKKAMIPFRIQIGSVKTDVIRGTAESDPDNPELVNFQVIAYHNIKETGRVTVQLYKLDKDYESVVAETFYEVETGDDGPDKQPLIDKLDPKGGAEGATVTVVGKNFGEDIDDISIEFVENEPYVNDDGLTFERFITDLKPFYLSKPEKGVQTLKFSIPVGRNLLQDQPDTRGNKKVIIFRNQVKIRVIVKGRPSDYNTLSILPPTWKIRTGFLSIVVMLIILGIIAFIMKRWNYYEMILLESTTNTYSLSRFQAASWTIVLMGAYFYLAISHGLLLRNGQIPDFNSSLLILLSISYGGLLTSHTLGNKKTKNERSDTPPALSNLIMEGGVISLPRLQMFGFTIVSIIIYLYTLYTSNLLLGLPDMPPTLLSLLGVSQGGYLGGKVMSDSVRINIVTPPKVDLSETDIAVNLVGSGFVDGTQVMFEGLSPVPAKFENPNNISFVVPKFKRAGKKTLVLIPPTGSTVTVQEALEVFEGLEGSAEDSNDEVGTYSTEPIDDSSLEDETAGHNFDTEEKA